MFKNINCRRNTKVDRKFAIVTCILAVFALSGCYQQPYEAPKIDSVPSKTVIPPTQHFGGVSVENRPIMYYALGQGDDITFIIAGIHGDEPAGPNLTNQLTDYLNQNRDIMTGHKVIILPAANPDGLIAEKRSNVNGVDLNRNFPSENRINSKELGLTALSEPEARIINELIKQYRPSRIVSIHQPYGCIDYDGPGETIANQMASYCDLPVKKVGALPGSLGSFAGETIGIPIITFEMMENDSNLNTQLLWQKYGKALLAAITYPNQVQ